MGIKDFGKLYKAQSTTLKRIIESSDSEDVRFGIDISVNIIQHMSRTAKAIDRYHSKPLLPIESLARYCCEVVVNPFIQAGGKVIIVFDGARHPLKGKEHEKRYGDPDAKKARLEDLYSRIIPGSRLVESDVLQEISSIKKELLPLRPDMIWLIMHSLKTRFKEKVHFIGAPYEADHQLGYLALSGAIDYVYTIDADIMTFGVNVIKAVNQDGKCELIRFDNLLNQVAKSMDLDKHDPPVLNLTKPILHHLGCFLGNDYIDRVHGNGKVKAKSFIASLIANQNVDGIFLTCDADIKNCVDNAIKKKVKDEHEREKLISHWFKCHAMYTYGPVFVIETHDGQSIREAITAQGNPYNVRLGQMDGSSLPWNASLDGKSDTLVGWNPFETFHTQLDGGRVSMGDIPEAFYKECTLMRRWSRNGVVINKLPLPLFDGKEMYHGSVLDFNAIPINCFALDDIKFFLSSRQVNISQCKEDEIYIHADKIWSTVGETLSPINPLLMRGSGGYVTPELLQAKSQDRQVSWFRDEDLLKEIRDMNISSLFNDTCFYQIFGKRNGTRKRIVFHLKGGSYDLSQLSATKDLTVKGDTAKNLFVFQGSCAPSQRLKDGNKEKFYSTRIVIELKEDGSFKEIMKPPLTSCNCPNGCIVCSHDGALIYMLYTISKLSHELSFEDMAMMFPEPVNMILRSPILVKDIWPPLTSDENIKKKEYKKKKRQPKANSASNQDGTLLSGEEFDEIDEYANEMKAIDGVRDASSTEMLKLCPIIDEWVEDLKHGKDSNGFDRKGSDDYDTKLRKLVEHKNSDLYRATQLKVLERVRNAQKTLKKSSRISFKMLEATVDTREAIKISILQKKEINFADIDLGKCVGE